MLLGESCSRNLPREFEAKETRLLQEPNVTWLLTIYLEYNIKYGLSVKDLRLYKLGY
jgi:hypothetical protein